MTRRYLFGFICLLLFVAAVDTIPDPPAINPPSGHNLTVATLHVHNSSTDLEKKWLIVADTIPSFCVDWVGIRFPLETRSIVASTVPLVLYASDPSPPSLA